MSSCTGKEAKSKAKAVGLSQSNLRGASSKGQAYTPALLWIALMPSLVNLVAAAVAAVAVRRQGWVARSPEELHCRTDSGEERTDPESAMGQKGRARRCCGTAKHRRFLPEED